MTAAPQPAPEESVRDRSGFCFWIAAHQDLELYPQLVQPSVHGESKPGATVALMGGWKSSRVLTPSASKESL